MEFDNDGIVSLGTSSSFGEDLMKKLIGLDFSLPVRLVPYSFTTDKGKNKRGITVYQVNTKVDSFYFDPMKKVSTNGIPETEGDTTKFDADDWKMHFMKVRKFLVGEVEKLLIYKKDLITYFIN